MPARRPSFGWSLTVNPERMRTIGSWPLLFPVLMLRRGLINGPGTIPALSGTCRVPPPPSRRPSAPTPNVILEQLRSLGATRRKASSNETFVPVGFSGTSVITANVTSVHRPSPSTTGSDEATSSRSSSTALFRALDFVRSLERRVSLTPRYDVWPIASGDTVFSFRRNTVPRRRPMSPSSWMAFEPSSTASTGRWTSIS
jgi:hypothetical protein